MHVCADIVVCISHFNLTLSFSLTHSLAYSLTHFVLHSLTHWHIHIYSRSVSITGWPHTSAHSMSDGESGGC